MLQDQNSGVNLIAIWLTIAYDKILVNLQCFSSDTYLFLYYNLKYYFGKKHVQIFYSNYVCKHMILKR